VISSLCEVKDEEGKTRIRFLPLAPTYPGVLKPHMGLEWYDRLNSKLNELNQSWHKIYRVYYVDLILMW
jgi:hypothetical protein